MLSTKEAATYCGFAETKAFKEWVRVAPVNYGATIRYDRNRLDDWLDTLSLSQPASESNFVEAAGNARKNNRN